MNASNLPVMPSRTRGRWRSCLIGVALSMLALVWPAVAAPHVDLVDYPRTSAQWDAFQDLRWRLVKDFDDTCGDTWCEGEYSDIQPLRIRCSVEASAGTVSHCRWAFAASDLGVDSSTGQIDARQPVWLCVLPIPPQTSVATFLEALSGPRPLSRRLPGATGTFHEALGDCLR